MQELKSVSMEHLTGKAAVIPAAAVQGIASNRMTEVSHVDTDLVGSSSLNKYIYETVPSFRLSNLPPCRRVFASDFTNRHLLPVYGMPTYRGNDTAFIRIRNTVQQGDIFLFNLPFLKQRNKAPVNVFVFGNQHDPGSVLVEPVDYTGANSITYLGNGLTMINKSIDKCPRMISASRVDHQTGGFGKHKKMMIFVDDWEIYRFRNDLKGSRHLYSSGNNLPSLQFITVFPRFAVNEKGSGTNRGNNPGTGLFRVIMYQEMVESNTGRIRFNPDGEWLCRSSDFRKIKFFTVHK